MRRVFAICLLLHFVFVVLAKHGEHESESDDDDDDETAAPPPSTQTSFVTVSTVFHTVTALPPPPEPQAQPSSPPATSSVKEGSPTPSIPPQSSSGNGAIPLTSPDGIKNTITSEQPSGSPTTTGTTPTASPLQFNPPSNMTTCTLGVITWEFFSTESIPVTIVITNERATTSSDNNSVMFLPRATMSTLVTRVLATSIQASTCIINWAKVDVPAGTYSAIAFDTERTLKLIAQSTNFVVSDGNDTSCVTGSDGIIPGLDGNDTGGQHRGRNLGTGALVGTIVGVVVGIGGLIAAFTLPGMIRRTLAKRERRPGAPYHLF